MGREGGTQSEASRQGWEGCATGDELPVMQGMSGRADTHTLGTLHREFLDAKGFCVPQSLHLQRGLDGGQDVGRAVRRSKTPAVSTAPAPPAPPQVPVVCGHHVACGQPRPSGSLSGAVPSPVPQGDPEAFEPGSE